MKPLRIGRVAKLTGVTVETVRFYEREGLLEQPPRRPSGYREYPEEVVRQIRFIKRAQQLGFTLKGIAELLALKHDPSRSACEVKQGAERLIAEITGRISTLNRMRDALSELTRACAGEGTTSECSILDALDQEENCEATQA